MPYSQTKQGGDVAVNLLPGTTGGASAAMANYGITQIIATTAEVVVLAPPTAGCEKTIIFHQYSTSVLPVVKLCTAGAQTVSILGSATNLTVIKSAATKSTVLPAVVTLKGISSTLWCITNVFPTMTGITTGSTIISSAVTLSST